MSECCDVSLDHSGEWSSLLQQLGIFLFPVLDIFVQIQRGRELKKKLRKKAKLHEILHFYMDRGDIPLLSLLASGSET